ncbi:hypothetical protein G6F57_021132 [Rhizopus arrhizus]|nr:hypothetical protein G6F57_021132 [Rhizopus arrhizus]
MSRASSRRTACSPWAWRCGIRPAITRTASRLTASAAPPCRSRAKPWANPGWPRTRICRYSAIRPACRMGTSRPAADPLQRPKKERPQWGRSFTLPDYAAAPGRGPSWPLALAAGFASCR